MSRKDKIRALIDCGEAQDRKEAICILLDMGE